jgi:hypothetical protein
VVDQEVFFHDLTVREEGLLLLLNSFGVHLLYFDTGGQYGSLVVDWGLGRLGFEINDLFELGFLRLLDFVDVIKLGAERLFQCGLRLRFYFDCH